MLCDYVVVNVRKNPMQVSPVTVFPHEIQILYAIHGESNIEIVDPFPDAEGRDLEPDEEYARLERRYGVDDEDGGRQSFVELIYGKPFLNNLKKEMELGKSRIVDESEAPDLTETDLKKPDGMKAKIKQLGGSYPPVAKPAELEAIMKYHLIDNIKKNGGKADKRMGIQKLVEIESELAMDKVA